MNTSEPVNLITMAECSHCGRQIPSDEAEKLRQERGGSPLLCKSCAPLEKEDTDLSDDFV